MITAYHVADTEDLVELAQAVGKAITVNQQLLKELANARALMIVILSERGASYRKIGALLGLSSQRVGQLILERRQAGP